MAPPSRKRAKRGGEAVSSSRRRRRRGRRPPLDIAGLSCYNCDYRREKRDTITTHFAEMTAGMAVRRASPNARPAPRSGRSCNCNEIQPESNLKYQAEQVLLKLKL